MTTEDLQGQVARSEAINRELREQVARLREELAEARRHAREYRELYEEVEPSLRARATAAESALAEARGALRAFGSYLAYAGSLHCLECGFAWGDASPNEGGDERCDDCESQHDELIKASEAYARMAAIAGGQQAVTPSPADDGYAQLEEQLCVATARLRELGHTEVVNEDESCCDACDRAIAREKEEHPRGAPPATPPPGEQGKGGGEGPGMVVCGDGNHAVCMDKSDPFYGWVMWRHPDGQWVSERRATPEEMDRTAAHLKFAEAIGSIAPAQPAEHHSDAITRARAEGATAMRERCALALEHPALSGDLPFPEAADVVREVPLPEGHPAQMVTCSTDTEEHHGPHRLRHPTRDEKSWCLDPVPAEHPASRKIQPAVGPAQDGGGADLPPSGIPLIDHDFVPNTWPKRDECDKRVSDDPDGPSRQCGRPRREHRG